MDVFSILSEAEAASRLAAVGRSERPKPPYTLFFPASLLAAAEKHLRRNGEYQLEQLVLMSGYPTERGVVLASLLMPETEATWGWIHVLPHEQPKIAEWLWARGQLMFLESHTHRGFGRFATEMSDEDRRAPASRQDGFLTLIVPGYAARGISFDAAGVWECRQLEWRRMTEEEVSQHLRPITDQEARDALL